jgi:hypothetical protein
MAGHGRFDPDAPGSPIDGLRRMRDVVWIVMSSAPLGCAPRQSVNIADPQRYIAKRVEVVGKADTVVAVGDVDVLASHEQHG